MLGQKASQTVIFQQSAFHFQGFKASKGAIYNCNLASSTWQELRTVQLSYCPIISNHLRNGALGCMWLTTALQESMLSNKGNFLIRHFLGNAISLQPFTWPHLHFFLADAAFSFSSVLTIDGGKVLAVQKFMWCRKSERSVCFPRALVVAAVQQRTRGNTAMCHFECHPQPNSDLGEWCVS